MAGYLEKPAGANLARDSGVSGIIVVAWTTVIASKHCSYRRMSKSAKSGLPGNIESPTLINPGKAINPAPQHDLET
jgi:hypothetical protein